jgi:hypothetical protein
MYMIDELLDELHGASWFTSLDLRAGYHLILLKPGEEFKTAFQTHLGHFEFRVMAFWFNRGTWYIPDSSEHNSVAYFEEMCINLL